MDDYGNFEKVGEIGATLPRNDVRITTEPGDIILYLGTRLCLYYSTNTYTFTRIGKIEDVTQEYLKSILGEGSVTVTFSLEKNDDENEYTNTLEKSETTDNTEKSETTDNTEKSETTGNTENSSDHNDEDNSNGNPKPSSNNKKSKTAIIAGLVSAAAVVVIVIAITLTCYVKKKACFTKVAHSESQ